MTKADCLKGATFCISGSLSVSKGEMTKTLKAAGAAVASSVTGKVTHVLSAQADVDKRTAKVLLAEGKGLPVVGESFVDACLKAGKKVAEKKHVLTAAGAAAAPAKGKKNKASGAAPGAKKAKKAKKVAGAAAAAAASAPAVIAADEVGGEDASVCSDAGEFLEAQLSQIDVASNTDKFYTIQVVHDASADTFYCVAHWGRTGTKGQTSVEQFDTQALATAELEKKFKSKTGVVYSSRKSYKAGPKKYSYKHVNYAREEAGAPLWQYYVDDGVDGKSVGWCKLPISASLSGWTFSHVTRHTSRCDTQKEAVCDSVKTRRLLSQKRSGSAQMITSRRRATAWTRCSLSGRATPGWTCAASPPATGHTVSTSTP